MNTELKVRKIKFNVLRKVCVNKIYFNIVHFLCIYITYIIFNTNFLCSVLINFISNMFWPQILAIFIELINFLVCAACMSAYFLHIWLIRM